jgi:hypothetical protein
VTAQSNHRRSGLARQWRVWFGGDPEYGRADVGEYRAQATVYEAPDASTAARKAMADWRREEAFYVREEGWYGDGTACYVQEVIEPPPVLTFVRNKGRMKKERAK